MTQLSHRRGCYCLECRLSRLAAKRKWRKAREAQGLCLDCGQCAAPHRKRCRTCLDALTQGTRRIDQGPRVIDAAIHLRMPWTPLERKLAGWVARTKE